VAAIETSAMAANTVSFGSVREKDMLAFPIWLKLSAVGIRCLKPCREEAKRRSKLETF
jgi:hypothetical protein